MIGWLAARGISRDHYRRRCFPGRSTITAFRRDGIVRAGGLMVRSPGCRSCRPGFRDVELRIASFMTAASGRRIGSVFGRLALIPGIGGTLPVNDWSRSTHSNRTLHSTPPVRYADTNCWTGPISGLSAAPVRIHPAYSQAVAIGSDPSDAESCMPPLCRAPAAEGIPTFGPTSRQSRACAAGLGVVANRSRPMAFGFAGRRPWRPVCFVRGLRSTAVTTVHMTPRPHH